MEKTSRFLFSFDLLLLHSFCCFFFVVYWNGYCRFVLKSIQRWRWGSKTTKRISREFLCFQWMMILVFLVFLSPGDWITNPILVLGFGFVFGPCETTGAAIGWLRFMGVLNFRPFMWELVILVKFEWSCLPFLFPDKLIGPVALVFTVKITVCSVAVVLIDFFSQKQDWMCYYAWWIKHQSKERLVNPQREREET